MTDLGGIMMLHCEDGVGSLTLTSLIVCTADKDPPQHDAYCCVTVEGGGQVIRGPGLLQTQHLELRPNSRTAGYDSSQPRSFQMCANVFSPFASERSCDTTKYKYSKK